MSQQGNIVFLRPLCFAPDPSTGNLLGFALEVQAGIGTHSLIRPKKSTETTTTTTTTESLAWEVVPDAKKAAFRWSVNAQPDATSCIADSAGRFAVVTVDVHDQIGGMRYKPLDHSWGVVDVRNQLERQDVMWTLTRPIRTSADSRGDVVFAHRVGLEIALTLVQYPGTDEEVTMRLNMGDATVIDTTVRMAYESNLLYYYRRSKGKATVTTVPMNSNAVIVNSMVQNMQSFEIPSTQSCSSDEFAGVLNSKFYYLCRAGTDLQLHNQTNLIGSVSLMDMTLLSFTPYDPYEPKAILLFQATADNSTRFMGGMNLKDGSLQFLSRDQVAVLTTPASPSITPRYPPASVPAGKQSSENHAVPILIGLLGGWTVLVLIFELWRRRKARRMDAKRNGLILPRNNDSGVGNISLAVNTPTLPVATAAATQIHAYVAPPAYRSRSDYGGDLETGSAPALLQGSEEEMHSPSAPSMTSQPFESSALRSPELGAPGMELEEIPFSRHPSVVTSVGE